MSLSSQKLLIALSVLALTPLVAHSQTSLRIFEGSKTVGPDLNSVTLQARARMELAGDCLTITLSNIGNYDVTKPAQVLTGVFFSVSSGTIAFTKDKALLNGSSVFLGPADITASVTGGNVGGEWAFKDNIGVGPSYYGISSTGLGIFGPSNRFDTGSNLSGPNNVGGLEYGITTGVDDSSTGNGGIMANELIKNSVTFSLKGAAGLNLINITAVQFQYGTNLSEPRITPDEVVDITGVPEPSEWAAMGMAAAGVAGLIARKRRRR